MYMIDKEGTPHNRYAYFATLTDEKKARFLFHCRRKSYQNIFSLENSWKNPGGITWTLLRKIRNKNEGT